MSLLAEKRRSTVPGAPRRFTARRFPVVADTAPATVPPALIGALAAVLADGPVELAGLAVAVFCGLAAAGFAAVDVARDRRRGDLVATGHVDDLLDAYRPGGGR